MTRAVSSRDNVWFKRFRRAVERHDDELVIEGRKQIGDCIANGIEVLAVASTDEGLLEAMDVPNQYLFSPSLIAALTDARNNQGIVALCRRPNVTLSDVSLRLGRLIVLDRVQDPGNVGTLIRLAAAFDCDAVLTLPGCADPFGPKTLRAAVGTTWLLPIVAVDMSGLRAFIQRERLSLVAADGAAQNLLGRDTLPQRMALVLGSEGEGVSAELLRAATAWRIETSPRVESLNVAAAAAIMLHETAKK